MNSLGDGAKRGKELQSRAEGREFREGADGQHEQKDWCVRACERASEPQRGSVCVRDWETAQCQCRASAKPVPVPAERFRRPGQTERRAAANERARPLGTIGTRYMLSCVNDSGINMHDGRRKSGRAGEPSLTAESAPLCGKGRAKKGCKLCQAQSHQPRLTS